MFKKFFISFLFISVTLFAGNIKIAVAADMSYTIQILIKEFNKQYPDVKVKALLGNGSQVSLMIKNGAKYDLFMSSNKDYAKSLYKDGFAVTEPVTYALDDLAIYSNKKRDFTKGIEILKDKNISKIFMADSKTTYYGKAAVEAMKRKKIYDDIKKKIVYIRPMFQSMSYNLSKNDVGITSKATMYSPHMAKYKKGENWAEINILLFTPIGQSVVILKSGENNKEVKEFYDFLFSADARKVFKKFGYTVE